MLENILAQYPIGHPDTITPFGSGLINHTWKITGNGGAYILQRINQEVFKQPEQIARNIQLIADYLQVHAPGYLFPSPVKTIDGQEMVLIAVDGYYRLFPFVMGSSSIDVVTEPAHAREAAKQFGRFTSLLAGFQVSALSATIPDFHNLSLRYAQFESACRSGNPTRISEAKDEIAFICAHRDIVTRYEALQANPSFQQRVTHHDTKISNVLFNNEGKGLCVVDLDTIMPGYFISDVGDMMRTYLSPVSEEEKDFSKISVREDFFAAMLEGYLEDMLPVLSKDETDHLVYAGEFMVYMQAIRFLTDYLNNDVYYGAAFEKHNYQRAGNQVALLQRIIDKEAILNDIVADVIAKAG